MKNVFSIFIMLVGITLVTGIVFFVFVKRNTLVSRSVFSAPIPAISIPPTQTPSYDAQVSSMDSPEGSKTLVLQKTQDDKGATYSAFVSAKSDEQIQQVLSIPALDSEIMAIPFNTWSPDNSYLFFTKKTPTVNQYLVLNSSGEWFANNTPYLSVQELFVDQVPDYSIEDVTGWAGPNLLIVNAKSVEDENTKVSFWLDVPSQSFIQLSTYFK
ncbi:MAG: hypothetical protein NUV52_01495 [Candidatus Roizmanbacteria bacterium]|nr:hypothetical protein [Candidatus Roizmanbacteria bacterium]